MSSETSAFPKAPDGYRYEGELGRGGMGVVYLATQLSTGQKVAIKILNDADFRRGGRGIRFRREMQIPAQLKHPHIVGVHASSWENPPYIALEYCSGGSLATRLLAETTTKSVQAASTNSEVGTEPPTDALSEEEMPRGYPLPWAEAVSIIIKIAQAAGALHDRGFLHRDIKPANILLDAQGEPKLADFGLAKLSDDHDVTARGDAVGSLAYMAPELIAGSAEAGVLTEVYALGVTLYELLCGTRPFSAKNPAELREKIRDCKPRSLEDIVPGLPRDLATICHKCLTPEPNQRYASTHELAQDLENWLAHRPIRARPPTLLHRTRLFVRRNPWATTAVLTAVLLAAGYLAWWWADSAHVASEVARLRSEAESLVSRQEFDEGLALLREAEVLLRQRSWADSRRAELQRFADHVVSKNEVKRRQAVLLVSQREAAAPMLRARIVAAISNATGLSSGDLAQQIKSHERGLRQFRVVEEPRWREPSNWSLVSEGERVKLLSEVEEFWFDYCNLQLRSQARSLRPVGLGLVLRKDQSPQSAVGRIEVIRADGPTAAAGLKPGDKIVAIDGKPILEFPNSEAIGNALKGSVGSKAEIAVLTGDKSECQKISVVRQLPEGIGLAGRHVRQLFVADVEPGSSAEKQGIHIGDLLLYIDGNPAEGPVAPASPDVSTFAGLAQGLHAIGPDQKHLIFWRPEDGSVHHLKVPWTEAQSRIIQRMEAGIMSRTIRTEIGGAGSQVPASEKVNVAEWWPRVRTRMIAEIQSRGGWTEEWLRLAWEETGLDASPRIQHAIYLQAQGKNAAAEQEWESYLQQHPNDWDALLNLIFCLYMQNRDSSVVEMATFYLQQRPLDQFAYAIRGTAHLNLEDTQAAKADFRRALQFGNSTMAASGLKKIEQLEAAAKP